MRDVMIVSVPYEESTLYTFVLFRCMHKCSTTEDFREVRVVNLASLLYDSEFFVPSPSPFV